MCWTSLFNFPEMRSAMSKTMIIHFNAPGHEFGADEIKSEGFLTFAQLAKQIETVIEKKQYLDYLFICKFTEMYSLFFFFDKRVRSVIGFGMGAGSDVLSEFVVNNADRTSGLFLIGASCTKMSYMEWTFFYKELWTIHVYGICESVLSNSVSRMFAYATQEKDKDLVEFYKTNLKRLNSKNVSKFVQAYMNKQDLSKRLEQNAKGKFPLLLCVGADSPCHDDTVHYNSVVRSRDFIAYFDKANLLTEECTPKVAECAYLFLLSCGLSLPHVIFKFDEHNRYDY